MNNNPPPSNNPAPRPPHWSLLVTVLLSFIVFVIFTGVQTIVFSWYGRHLINSGQASSTASLQNLVYDGNALAYAEIPAAIIGILVILFFTSLRKTISIEQYLSLKSVSIPSLLRWLGLMLLILICLETIGKITGRETPEFMSDIYRSSNNLLLLWFAVAIAAPFFEEFLFRGFLFEGLRNSVLGYTGASLITAGIWAVIHIQYEWFEIFVIFILGLFFGYAKVKSGSLYVPIALHALMNFAAMFLLYLVESQKVALPY